MIRIPQSFTAVLGNTILLSVSVLKTILYPVLDKLALQRLWTSQVCHKTCNFKNLQFTYYFFFSAVGTKIAVYGDLGPTQINGVPTTMYAIDGVILGSYTAPFVASDGPVTTALFFQSQDLSDAKHTLVIKMTNGTSPNMFWFDYFSYTASQALVSSQTPSISSSVPTSSGVSRVTAHSSSESVPSISSQSSSPIPSSSGASSVTAQPSQASSRTAPSSSAPGETIHSNTSSTVSIPSQSASASGTSSSKTRIGPIIGGVVGGVLFLIAFALFLFICLKKRARRYERPPSEIEQIPGEFPWCYSAVQSLLIFFAGVTPFPVWENRTPLSGSQETDLSAHTQNIKPPSTSSPSHSRPRVTSLVISASQPIPVPVPPTSEIPQSTDMNHGSPTGLQAEENHPPPAEVRGRKNSTPVSTSRQEGASNEASSSSGPILQHHVDSGVRLPWTTAVVDIPPPYTEI